MKFFTHTASAVMLLLAACATVVSGVVQEQDTCGERSYPLTAIKSTGGVVNLGWIHITDDQDNKLVVNVAVTGDLGVLFPTLPRDPVPTLLESVKVTATCEDNGVKTDTVMSFEAGEMPTEIELELEQPSCLVDVLVKVDVKFMKPGGVDALKYIFAQPIPVSFVLELDPRGWSDLNGDGITGDFDKHPEEYDRPSYYDTVFTGDSYLRGLRIDGYCVDVVTGIYMGTTYSGVALSFSNTEALSHETYVDISKLPMVAWLVNHYKAHDRPYPIPTDVPAGYETPGKDPWLGATGYTMQSSTLQRAIWYIMDKGQSSSGLQASDLWFGYNEAWAKYLAWKANQMGASFSPGCNDQVPIILIPNVVAQHTIALTTFEALGIPCRPSQTVPGIGRARCGPDDRVGGTTTTTAGTTTTATITTTIAGGDTTTTATGGTTTTATGGTTSPPAAWGDPHFKTWVGEDFDYHGACDLVFLEDPARELVMHIRTTIRDDWSYISSVALQVKTDLLEVSAWGNYFINGVNTPELNATLGGLPISMDQRYRKRRTFVIRLSDEEYIEFKTFKDLVAVKLFATAEHFAGSRGILGHPETGKMVGRDGVTVFSSEDQDIVNDYGQEWQVRHDEPKLFHINRAPQYPSKCELAPPTSSLTRGRRLGEQISREDAEAACAHWSTNQESCVQDVIRSGDLELASADIF